jgi:hypothetical protein
MGKSKFRNGFRESKNIRKQFFQFFPMGFCIRQNFWPNFWESCGLSRVNYNKLGVNARLMMLKLQSIDVRDLAISRTSYGMSFHSLLEGEKINVSILGNLYLIYCQRRTYWICILYVGSNSACQKESIAQFFVIFGAYLGGLPKFWG